MSGCDNIFWPAYDTDEGVWRVMTQRSMGSAFHWEAGTFETQDAAWAWITSQGAAPDSPAASHQPPNDIRDGERTR